MSTRIRFALARAEGQRRTHPARRLHALARLHSTKKEMRAAGMSETEVAEACRIQALRERRARSSFHNPDEIHRHYHEKWLKPEYREQARQWCAAWSLYCSYAQRLASSIRPWPYNDALGKNNRGNQRKHDVTFRHSSRAHTVETSRGADSWTTMSIDVTFDLLREEAVVITGMVTIRKKSDRDLPEYPVWWLELRNGVGPGLVMQQGTLRDAQTDLPHHERRSRRGALLGRLRPSNCPPGWATAADSVRAGNCHSGTRNFVATYIIPESKATPTRYTGWPHWLPATAISAASWPAPIDAQQNHKPRPTPPDPMGEKSKIGWTDASYNHSRGCTELSEACEFCFARELAKRNPEVLGQWGPGAPRVRAAHAYTLGPARWNAALAMTGARKRVFAFSLGDWLDDEIPVEWLAEFLLIVSTTPQLDWLLLTKRPENWSPRLAAVKQFIVEQPHDALPVGGRWRNAYPGTWHSLFRWVDGWHLGLTPPPANVWAGVTMENEPRAEDRAHAFMRIPAVVKFISAEPLLGSVDFASIRLRTPCDHCDAPLDVNLYTGTVTCAGSCDGPAYKYPVNWLITGGESHYAQPNLARPTHADWLRRAHRGAQEHRVPVFFKQWGHWRPFYDPEVDDPDRRRIPTTRGNPMRRWVNLDGGQGMHGDRPMVYDCARDTGGNVIDAATLEQFPTPRTY